MYHTSYVSYAAALLSGSSYPVLREHHLTQHCGFIRGSSAFPNNASVLFVSKSWLEISHYLLLFAMIGFWRGVIAVVTMADIAVAQQYGAMLELGEGISPRYFLGSPPLEKRQSGVCAAGQHHCRTCYSSISSSNTDFCQARTSTFHQFAAQTIATAMSMPQVKQLAVPSAPTVTTLVHQLNTSAALR